MVEATRVKAGEIKKFLDSRGYVTWLCSAWDSEEAAARLDGTELLLTVGGDGTILRAAQVAAPAGIPVTGINLGKLGFLTECNAGEALDKLPTLLEGQSRTDERAMLQVELASPGGETRTFHALNDAVLARGEIARVIRVEVSVDGELLTTYKADGVIVATATGSTGYALAAGGPVLHPQSEDFLLVPVAPHLTAAYTAVLPNTAELRLRITAVHPATLSIDGHINLPLSGEETVTVRRSPHTVRFLRIHPGTSFFGSLEERLKGRQVEPDRKG